MNITTSNYSQASSAINWAGAPDALKNGRTFFNKVTKEGTDLSLYNKSEGIQKTIDLYLEKLNEYSKTHNKGELPSPKPAKAKGIISPKKAKIKVIEPDPTPEPVQMPAKNATKKPTKKHKSPMYKKSHTAKKAKTITLKKSKAKVRKVAAKVAKAVRKADAAKIPVTVNKKSLELQLIKTFTGMDKKSYTLKAIAAKHTSLKNYFKKGAINDHKAIIQNILIRLTKAKTAMEKQKATDIKTTLDTGFKNKCLDLVKNAKPKLQVNYLAGMNKDSYKEFDLWLNNSSQSHIIQAASNFAHKTLAEFNKSEGVKYRNIRDFIAAYYDILEEWFIENKGVLLNNPPNPPKATRK